MMSSCTLDSFCDITKSIVVDCSGSNVFPSGIDHFTCWHTGPQPATSQGGFHCLMLALGPGEVGRLGLSR